MCAMANEANRSFKFKCQSFIGTGNKCLHRQSKRQKQQQQQTENRKCTLSKQLQKYTQTEEM